MILVFCLVRGWFVWYWGVYFLGFLIGVLRRGYIWYFMCENYVILNYREVK